MSSDAELHRDLLSALQNAQGKGDGSFERAVMAAFEHIFDHFERPNSDVPRGSAEGEDLPLKPGESATLR